ncbi:MAG: hypothetical protein QXK06_03620 [Candidatus Diapherotrites archaeon]
MSSTKEEKFKEFLISERKKIGSGITSAPVWIMQKAGKRVYNRRQARSWKEADFGSRYRKRKLNEKRQRRGKPVKNPAKQFNVKEVNK